MRRRRAAPTSPRSAGTWPGTSSSALAPNKGTPAGPASGPVWSAAARPSSAAWQSKSPGRRSRGSLGQRPRAGLAQTSCGGGEGDRQADAEKRQRGDDRYEPRDLTKFMQPFAQHSGRLRNCQYRFNDAASGWFRADDGPLCGTRGTTTRERGSRPLANSRSLPGLTPRSRLSLLGRLHPESNLPRNRTCNEAGRARRKRRRSASTTTDHRQQHMSGRERLGAWTQW